MEFSPANNVVKLCLQSMEMEAKGDATQAASLSLKAWNEATNDQEKFIAAHFVARYQTNTAEKLQWLQTALEYALKINDDTVKSALPGLYANMAKCYTELNDPANAIKNEELSASFRHSIADKGPFYHGTRANLKTGDMLIAGYNSNYQAELTMNHIYFTALANGAGLAAALAKDDGPEHVYIVEPTGDFENDPNVTDKKFPGNPTRSYRTSAPLKVIGELTDWARLSPEDIKKWREKLAKSTGEIIN